MAGAVGGGFGAVEGTGNDVSTLDREPRISGGPSTPLHEPRIDPGTNAVNPPRVDMPPKLSTPIPRGPNLTGPEKKIPVKR